MPGGVSHTSPRVDGVGGCEPPPALLLPQKWRPFCLQFEGVVEDFNYGTLLRLDCRGGYSPENTIFGTETPSGGLLGTIVPPLYPRARLGTRIPHLYPWGSWVPLPPVLYLWAQLGTSIPHRYP